MGTFCSTNSQTVASWCQLPGQQHWYSISHLRSCWVSFAQLRGIGGVWLILFMKSKKKRVITMGEADSSCKHSIQTASQCSLSIWNGNNNPNCCCCCACCLPSARKTDWAQRVIIMRSSIMSILKESIRNSWCNVGWRSRVASTS